MRLIEVKDLSELLHEVKKLVEADVILVVCIKELLNTATLRSFMEGRESVVNLRLLEIEISEQTKNLEAVQFLWEHFLKLDLTRSSVVISIGGGVLMDIVGFAAGTFKRGIPVVNLPTTLLAMVDAGYGGKTGLNFYNYKNLIGCFSEPLMFCLHLDFLRTLPEKEIRSGYAECLKHGLLESAEFWKMLIQIKPGYRDFHDVLDGDFVKNQLRIKEKFVRSDLYDTSERMMLNAGHTVGHAMESVGIKHRFAFTHGDFVAWGLLLESIIIDHMVGRNLGMREWQKSLFNFLVEFYPQLPLSYESLWPEVIDRVLSDKKTVGQFIVIVDIHSPGKYKLLKFPFEDFKSSAGKAQIFLLHKLNLIKY